MHTRGRLDESMTEGMTREFDREDFEEGFVALVV